MSAQQIAALKQRAKLLTPTKSNMESTVNLCICNRQLQDILCRSCGYLFVGRQRRQCVIHPNEIHLMDAAVCPKCRTNSLIEIKTSDTPIKKQQDDIETELSHLRQRRSSGTEKVSFGVQGTSTKAENWEEEIHYTPHTASSISATFDTYHQAGKATTTDKDWEKELGSSNQPKTSLRSASALHGPAQQYNTSSATFASTLPTKMSSESFGTSHLSKTALSSCIAEDWGQKVSTKQVPKACATVGTASQMLSMKYDEIVAPQFRNVSRRVTFAPPKTGKETHIMQPVSAHDHVIQQGECKTFIKPESKLVDSEVQTEFIVQVMEEPEFLHQVAQPALQQSEASPNSGYRRAIDDGKETSVLRAAIKRSIAQDWHREMDKMNVLCIGDRRF